MKKKSALFVVLLTTLFMTAQTQPLPTVDVTGKGIVRVVPDEVTITVRIENTGTNAKEVKQENDRIVNEVLSFVKRMKISDKDVSTQYIRLNKNYEYNTKTYNYAANQSIAIKLRKLKDYEELMDGLLESGINRIDGISFSASNKEELESEARKKAVANAKMKAEEYAGVLDQTIGKAISISEYRASNAPSPMYRTMAMDSQASAGQQTIAAGEMEIIVTVNISFLLN